LWACSVGAAEWSGELAVEARLFPYDPLDSRQHGANGSVAFEPEFFHDWQDGQQRFAWTPFIRWDQGDKERTHWDFRELYWRKSFASAELYLGARKVFWGVTESLHLVDVINQTDLVENLDTEDKLGQPMVQLTLLRDWGTVDFYLLPYFRERAFAGTKARLRGPVAVADKAVYEADAEEWSPHGAVRWSHYIGDADIAVGHFYGTGREPRFLPGPEDLLPHYDLLHQTSLELQYIWGDWLGKLEAVRRDGIDGSSLAAVGGVEFTQVGILSSAADLGWVGEYQYDNRDAPFFPVGDNDIAAGLRLTFNDVQDTDILAFVAIDTDKGSRFGSVEGNRRLGQSGELRLEGRFFAEVDGADPLFFLRRDDYLQLEFIHYF
jgi:hypothetical protein